MLPDAKLHDLKPIFETRKDALLGVIESVTLKVKEEKALTKK